MNLEIADGEFLVLVGPSGCGKTTTLRMIAGLEDPTDGQIYIGDEDVTFLEPKHRDIAMVFQNYALYPHMKVYDNMAYSLKLRNYSKTDIGERISNVAEMLGISNLLDRYPRQLSGGQQQRVALGRAIVRHPKVFLMDEPLSNLDAKLRVQTRAELIKLHRQLKTTIVYVTHDQVEAMTMGTRIVVMRDGYVQQVGTPREIYYQPSNMFVGGFVGAPPMQFLHGSLDTVNDTVVFRGNGFNFGLPGFTLSAAGTAAVVLGLRPEGLEVVAGEGEPAFIPAAVEVIENIGSELMVHTRTAGGETLIARLDGTEEELCVGAVVALRPVKGNIHLFDAATGNRLHSFKASI